MVALKTQYRDLDGLPARKHSCSVLELRGVCYRTSIGSDDDVAPNKARVHGRRASVVFLKIYNSQAPYAISGDAAVTHGRDKT